MVSAPWRVLFVDCRPPEHYPSRPAWPRLTRQQTSRQHAGHSRQGPNSCCAASKPCSTRPPGRRSRRRPTGCGRSTGTSSARCAGSSSALFVFGGLIAMLDVTIPAFIGRVVGLVSTHAPRGPAARDLAAARSAWPACCCWLRPLVFLGHIVLINQIVNPGLSNMIRWQNHWHVVRQSWTFFQNDFAGRIANRVLQTGPSLRESLVMAFDAAWYIIVYGSSALLLLASVDWRLTPPILLWFVRLRRHPALFRAAPARTLARGVRDALDADRPRGGQLHQHPDGQAVLPRARRGRVRARGDRPAHRRVPRPDADDHRLCRDAGADERDADRRHREPGDLAVERRAHLASARWRWCCRCPGRSPTWPAGWRAASPRSSRTSARCRTACARSPSSGRCPTRRTRANCA